MRLLTISALVLLLITGQVILESCCGVCGCGDGNFTQAHFDIDDMSLSSVSFPFGSSALLSSPATFSNVALQVKLDVTYSYAQLRNPFGSALFACSPPPSISNQLISDLTITSNNTLETTAGNTPAGNNLSLSFEVYGPSYWEQPVHALIAQEYLDEYISFRSKAVLSKTQTHTFTIVITLDDGRAFTLVTSQLELI